MISCQVFADDVPDLSVTDKGKYVITIDRFLVDDMRINDTLDIWLRSGEMSLAAFDLKIGTTADFFGIVDILPGEICDSCNWDFFNVRRIESKTPNSPGLLWQIVALSDMISDSTVSRCYGLNRPATLARLVVSSEFISEIPDTSIPIYFYWEDCTDNTVSAVGGTTLYMGEKVIEYYKPGIKTTGEQFPSLTGPLNNCIKASSLNKPLKKIEFHNGGVEFKLDLQTDSLLDNSHKF